MAKRLQRKARVPNHHTRVGYCGFWVAHKSFRDDTTLFYDTVRDNVAAGAKYVYFIRKDDAGKRFEAFQKSLNTDIGYKVDDRVVPVPFNSTESDILAADFVVANPRKEYAVGFQSLWERQPADNILAVRLPADVLRDRVNALVAHVTRRDKDRVSAALIFPVRDALDFPSD